MTKKELKEAFRNTMILRVNILRSISIDYNYAKFLFLDSNSTYLNSHWRHIRYNFLKLLIIDVAKLFTDNNNQKLNFFKFFNRLEEGDYKKLGINHETIKHFRSVLNKYELFFNVIQKYRDKMFAHTEINAGIIPHETFFIKLEELINIGFEICNETSKTISGKEIINILKLTDLTTLKIS